MEKHISWLRPEEEELEQRVLAEYSVDEVRKHLEYFSTLTRRAGSEDELKAAKYINGKLEEFAVDSEIHEFDAYVSLPGKAELEVTSPGRASFPSLPRTFIVPTPPDGLEGEVIALDKGSEEEYRSVDPRGKIVLVRPRGIEGRLETARIAGERGALALIHISSGKARTISAGQIRYTWGNPTPDTIDKLPKLPVISVCGEDGKYLADLSKKGRLTVRVKADAWRGYKKARLPVGSLKGTRDPEKYVLFGGHYCSWFLGATDNAVANSMMLEMARIFSKYRKHLGRGIRFAWWTGHEQGTYAGSTWYVDQFWEDLRDHAVAYLVLDGLGRTGSSGIEPSNTEEIRKFHETVIKEVLGFEARSKELERAGDQSFWGIGLPSFTGGTKFTAEQTAAMEGNWYGHAAEDTLDKVDMSLIAIPFKVYSVSMLRLCNNPVLPLEFVTMAEVIKNTLNGLQETGRLDLTSVITRSEEMREKAGALNGALSRTLLTVEKKGTGSLADQFGEVNAGLMALSRIMIPPLYCKAGKYGQDPMMNRSEPIPGLQGIKRLAAMESDQEEYKASLTSFLRERNKLSDALDSANGLLEDVLNRI